MRPERQLAKLLLVALAAWTLGQLFALILCDLLAQAAWIAPNVTP